ncbi:hypothetical protein NADFUDRAFT_40093 [Nadsonia fulvescens var. elongata DSM 6958]|uniref:Uncharacterized protein n=1 Tax=Nadsonia fulvescens var. elongata DSM 6958 TaxID=857566 RepID=A0A1E3PN99_9ASCO|nr:hypothetical protein NADFUDRAFT_40093 [Nadsonia fulvescens var. elongata DSM 6958]
MSKGLRKSQNNSNKQLIQFDGNEVQSNSSMFESRPTGSIVEFPNPHTPGNFHECPTFTTTVTGDYQLERIPQTQYTAAETRPLRYSPAVGRNSAVNTTQAMPFWRPPNSHIKTMQVVSSKYNTLQKKNSNEVTETWPNSMTQKAKIVLLTLRITVGCLVLNHQPLWGLALFVLFFGSYAIDEMDNRLKKCRLMQTQNRNMAGYATCDNTDYRKIK